MIAFQKPIEAFILHHTETAPDYSIARIRAFHTAAPPQGRGWAEIGYHYLIRQGHVWPGRAREFIGAHAPGWNSRSLGIALVGDYRRVDPPEEQLDELCRLLTDLGIRFGRLRVLSHREAMAEVGEPDHTDCPGRPWVDLVRARLAWDLEDSGLRPLA